MTENLKKFLEKVSESDELAQKVSAEEDVNVLIAMAKDMGITLTADDFKAMHSLSGQSEAPQTTTPPATEGLTLDEIEKQAILQAISRYRGNLSLVAVELGISRGALYRRLEKYGIE